MTEYLDDEYWIGVFKRMSTGRFLKNFKLIGPELIHRGRGGKTCALLVPKEPEKVGDVIAFFHECGVFSAADEHHNNELLEAESGKYVTKVLEWRNISKNKLLLEQALVHFARRKIAEVRGTDDEMLALVRLLKLATILKALTKSNVVVEDNEIVRIANLAYDPAKSPPWEVDFSCAAKARSKSKAKQRKKPESLSEAWSDVLELMLSDPAALKARRLRKKAKRGHKDGSASGSQQGRRGSRSRSGARRSAGAHKASSSNSPSATPAATSQRADQTLTTGTARSATRARASRAPPGDSDSDSDDDATLEELDALYFSTTRAEASDRDEGDTTEVTDPEDNAEVQ
jgi:hypothetical protein